MNVGGDSVTLGHWMLLVFTLLRHRDLSSVALTTASRAVDRATRRVAMILCRETTLPSRAKMTPHKIHAAPDAIVMN